MTLVPWLRRHPLFGYFASAFGISWGGILILFIAGDLDLAALQLDIQMRTNVSHIFAIGDIVGQPMLAHKAVHEAHVAAEVIANW